ncbi:MAG TPA: SAM-dependent methyltransferase, partial [Marmoricola sp.]|nr:SAM-dependent methyltransferase [Marmoricola sp.]
MSEPLLRALNRMRSVILDPDQLVKAVASGRQKGTQPKWRRAELRYVDLKAGTHLQITTYDATQAFTANHPVGDAEALDALLEEPFANWHVDTTTESHHLMVTKP